MDEVCQCLTRQIFVQVSLDLRLDSCFPIINMSLKTDGVDALGEVGLGGPGSTSLFGEI